MNTPLFTLTLQPEKKKRYHFALLRTAHEFKQDFKTLTHQTKYFNSLLSLD